MRVPTTLNQRLACPAGRVDLIIHPTVSETTSNVQLVYPPPLSHADIKTSRTAVAAAALFPETLCSPTATLTLATCAGGSATRAPGNRRLKRAPPQGALSTHRSPPCSRTVCRVRASPRPRPLRLPAVTNGWKSLERISTATPGPVSST